MWSRESVEGGRSTIPTQVEAAAWCWRPWPATPASSMRPFTPHWLSPPCCLRRWQLPLKCLPISTLSERPHCQWDAILVILRCLRRPQRRGSEIHAESFAPYGHCAVFSQVQVVAKRVVLVTDVALDGSQIDETGLFHRRCVLGIVRGDDVDVYIRTV